MIGRLVVFNLVTLIAFGISDAQIIPVIPKEKLDSIANPKAMIHSPILFENTTMDIATVNEDDNPPTVSFTFRNIGDKPFVIDDVVSGCDCTGADYPDKEINPGERGEILVTYYPKGHPGMFSRKIEVFLNLYPEEIAAVLTLKGKVLPSTYPTHNYPVAMSTLLLKRKEVEMPEDRKAVESIEVMNAGESPLNITADSNLLPSCFQIKCEPAQLMPGQIGNLDIYYNPENRGSHNMKKIPIVLKGLNGPSSLRTIYVKLTDPGK